MPPELPSFFYITPQGARRLAGSSINYRYVKNGFELLLPTCAKLRYSISANRFYVQSFDVARNDIKPFWKYAIQ